MKWEALVKQGANGQKKKRWGGNKKNEMHIQFIWEQ